MFVLSLLVKKVVSPVSILVSEDGSYLYGHNNAAVVVVRNPVSSHNNINFLGSRHITLSMDCPLSIWLVMSEENIALGRYYMDAL